MGSKAIWQVVFFVVFTVVPTVSVRAAAPDCSGYPAAYAGAGTSGDPYQVSDLAGLQCMSRSLSSYYVLTADIDASETAAWNSGAGFAPVGPDSGSPFIGGFDGDNHVVSGLFIHRTSESYVGLFGFMTWQTKYVRNLGLVDVDIDGGYKTGGLAGVLLTQNPVSNVFVTGSVQGNTIVGGLSGANMTTVQDCYVTADVMARNYRAGGFIGENYGATVTDSYFAGTVTTVGGANLGAFIMYEESAEGKIGNVFYDASLASGLPACHSGCDDDTITGKTTAEMGEVATFTDLSTAGLSSAWDFVGDPNDDSGTYDRWTVSGGYPTLASFLGLADQDADGYDMIHDCDDENPDVFEEGTYYVDQDGDEYGTSASTTRSCGVPTGYSETSDDCDDTDETIHPHSFFLDTDDDGYGDVSESVSVCGGPSTTAPEGYVADGTDCDDADDAAFMYTVFYSDADDDGFGISSPTTRVCGGLGPSAPTGYAANVGDCDDADGDLYPGSFDGSGTEDDPYVIMTLRELACINGTEDTRSADYELGADIDASETETWNGGDGFEPIGPSRTEPFTGSFDGMGHVISNLHIDRTADAGFFGFTDYHTGHIRNLGLEDVDMTGGFVGGLANVLQTDKPVENVYVTGTITGTRPAGLAAVNWSDISNCYTDVTVTSTGNWMAGGFVAENHGGDISDSYVAGDVVGNDSRIGAFLSLNDGGGTITSSFYVEDSLSLGIGACPSTWESGFGGCEGQEITGKSDTESGLIETFTSLVTEGLSSAWDFLSNPNDDEGIRNLWKMAARPILAVFTGEADQDADGHAFADDCDDRDAEVFEVTEFYPDGDGDGYGIGEGPVLACGMADAPDGYAPTSDDCDDTDETIHPHSFFLDTDDDGYGDVSESVSVCGGPSTTAPEGYVADGTDCDDADDAAFMYTVFYSDADDDGFGISSPTTRVCGGLGPSAPTGYAANVGDCDDADGDLYPGSFDGSGTEDDPYVIMTLRELACINGTEDTRSADYELGADIDASETETWNGGDGFEPIGPSRTEPFTGSFDGMGHVISNLHIDRTADAGFFGFTDYHTGHIRNLGLEDVDMTGGFVGGLANVLQTDKPVENVYVTGTITGTRPAGLAAVNWSDISNCYTDVTVTSTGNWMAGGFVAENHGGDISDSYVAGDVVGNDSRIGAFLSLNDGGGTITSSFYVEDSLSLGIGACPSTWESGFGGCEGQEITGKSDTESGLIETFTSLVTEGLSSAWDFLSNPNDDEGIRNLWKMAARPILAVFTGEADQDADGHAFADDCDDRDAEVFEVTTYYDDTDGDEYGDPSKTANSCGMPSGYASNADDCDPSDENVYYRTFYSDLDADGYGLDGTVQRICGGLSTPTPEGYAVVGGDCDDADPDAYPRKYYLDGDGDGYGVYETELPICEGGIPEGYVSSTGDGDDADPDVSPGVGAEITIGTDVVSSDIEGIGADLSSIAGGTNFAKNNLVWNSGFEPASLRSIERVERTGVENGYRWMEWDFNGGIPAYETRSAGFLNGASLRFYRLVDADDGPVFGTSGDNMRDVSSADHVVFLGEATIPEPNGDLPGGGFSVDESEGGERRIYIDREIGLRYGDYVLMHFETPYMPADRMDSRLLPYRDADHPGMNLFWADGATGRLVSHPGPIPDTFAIDDPGETCLRVEATRSGTVKFGQYVYEGSNPDDMWYSQLHPGDTYRVEAWMRQDGLSDGGHVRFAFEEGSGAMYYSGANQEEPWTVTGEWKKYTYDFVAPEYPSGPGIIAHTLNFSGPGTLYVDNWLIYTYDEVHGYQPFGPHKNSLTPVLASVPENGKKPTVRFYPVQYDDSSVDSVLGNYPNGSFNSTTGDIGSGNAMTIAQSIRWAYATGGSPDERVVPWITVPEEYTEIDFEAIVEYLGVPYDPSSDTPESKPYAYKRYVQRQGNGTPWTSEFREILLEYGNETWHQGAGGYGWNGFSQPGSINYGGKEYGLFAQYMFGEYVMRTDEWSDYGLGSKIKLVLGGNYIANTYGQTSYGEQAMLHNDIASYLGHANYVGPKWETGDTGSSTFNDHGVQETLVGPVVSSTVRQLIDEAASVRDTFRSESLADYGLVAYEGGPSGYWSGAGTEVDERYGKSLAMGVSALDAWLYSSLKGYGYQNYHALQGGIWWTSHTMPEQGGFRPQPGWLALMLRNRYAVGSDMVSVSVDSTPSYLREGELVPLISSYAIRNGSGEYSVFVLSRKLDGTHDGATFGDGYTPVTIRLPFGMKTPNRITLHKLARPDGTPADPREGNRNGENVAIVSDDIDIADYSTDFVIDESTGGEEGGMPPGTVYLYTFSFDCDGSDSCTDADADGYSASDDCDDSDASIHSERAFYADADGDGYGTFTSAIEACQAEPPTGYAGFSGDCDENDVDANDPTTPYYRDLDGDGYGDTDESVRACGMPAGYVPAAGDCDDSNASLNLSCPEAGHEDSGDSTADADDDDDDDSGSNRHRSPVSAVARWMSGSGVGQVSSDDGMSSASDGDGSSLSDRDAILRALDEATESSDMTAPTITDVIPFLRDGFIRFQGTGTPDSDIVLIVHSDTKLVKRIRVDGNGFWNYDHSQKDVFLEPGAHEAYVVAYDSGKKLKSAPSPVKGFDIKASDGAGDSRESYFDRKTIVILIGVLIMGSGSFLFLKRRKKIA
ncbi:MAG: hypothetical protein HGA16_00210 [Candidatus Moranbacteria bacterium]|nr:hypothetical protein [Candidatus Moranbacteria bacterium]